MVAAGLAAGHRPQVVFLREDVADELGERLGLAGEGSGAGAAPAAGPSVGAVPRAPEPSPSVFVVNDRVAARVSTLETPADAVAVFPLPERRPVASLLGPGSGPKAAAARRAAGEPAPETARGASPAAGLLLVYVDGVQDPGNLGTLVRAAVAFGAGALITSPGCADLYGPKTVRAGMGALFGLRLFPDVRLADVLDQVPVDEVYGLSAHEGAPLADGDLRRPAVLVVGAERAGLSRGVRALVTRLVTIPLAPVAAGSVESLNAGVAGAIALYEFSRRPAGASDDPPRCAAAPQEG